MNTKVVLYVRAEGGDSKGAALKAHKILKEQHGWGMVFVSKVEQVPDNREGRKVTAEVNIVAG